LELGFKDPAARRSASPPLGKRDRRGEKLSQRLDRDARDVARRALATADFPQPYRAFWMKYLVSP
jgi:hypothetical protein